jgi:hypothetical protein
LSESACKCTGIWLTMKATAALATLPSGFAFDAIPSSSMMVGRGTIAVQRRLSTSEARALTCGEHR